MSVAEGERMAGYTLCGLGSWRAVTGHGLAKRSFAKDTRKTTESQLKNTASYFAPERLGRFAISVTL